MNRLLEAVQSEYHGALAGLHGFAGAFFLRRGSYRWAAFHFAAAFVSLVSSVHHRRNSR